MKEIAGFSFEKDPHADVWEDGEAKVNNLTFCLWVEGQLIEHADLPVVLGKLNAEFLNAKIAVSYPHLYKFSQETLEHQGVYIPHFELRIVHLLSSTEVDLCFEKLQTPYGGEHQSVWWCISFDGEDVADVRWETN